MYMCGNKTVYLLLSSDITYSNTRSIPLVSFVSRLCEVCFSIYKYIECSGPPTIHVVKERKAHFAVKLQLRTANSCIVTFFSGIRCLCVHVKTC